MKLKIPLRDELASTPYYFGRKEVFFLPKQFELVFAMEPEVGYIGGYGSAKTSGGIMRATRLSTWYPGNKGIIGRYASTDLAATTQADARKFWEEANLLEDFVDKGKYKVPTATLKCVDPMTQEILKGKYSEVLFQHLDDPTHIHGHHIGWAWADEASEISSEAYRKLISRLRLPGFEKIYSIWVTGNPEGHNWVYDHFFNPENVAKLKPEVRERRRAIHATTYENTFLPKEYVQNMHDSYSDAVRKIYLEGSFDVFDGQIYEEFREPIHVINRREVFSGGIPMEWNRLLAVDVGGSDPWAWLWAAIDFAGNIIIYDEIYRPGVKIEPFAIEALPKTLPFKFQAKVIDYENKLAAGMLQEHGITFTNAKKQNKNDSIFRVSGYLHPNENHGFPDWHPKKGSGGSPRLFITDNCKNLIRELPQQRWRKMRGIDGFENEADPNVSNHAVDALCYLVRELPRPSELDKSKVLASIAQLDPMSRMMHQLRREAEAKEQKRKMNVLWGTGRFHGRAVRMA